MGWQLSGSTAARSEELGRERFSSWLELVAAVACWPFGSVAVERRFTAEGRRGALREYLLLRSEGAGLVASPQQLELELRRLARPLIARYGGARALSTKRVAAILDASCVVDVAELREASDLAPEGTGPLELAFAALVEDLQGNRGATASVLAATPTGRIGNFDVEGTPDSVGHGGSPLQVRGGAASPRRWVRFRLRLASTPGQVQESAMARAAAIALGPEACPADSWHRAQTQIDLEHAQRQSETLGSEPWGEPSDDADERLTTTAAAALRAWLPSPASLAGGSALTPLARAPKGDGALLGRYLLDSGRFAPARLPWAARTGHHLVVGATGTGKTTLLERLIDDDLRADRALVVMTLHEDLADRALALVPAERRRQTVAIDPADRSAPPLEAFPSGKSADPRGIATSLADAFEELFAPRGGTEFLGPFFHQAVTNAVLALTESTAFEEPLTLIAVERFLTEQEFRREVIDALPHGTLREQLRQYDQACEASGRDWNPVNYMTSKLAPLTSGPARPALEHPARYRLSQLLADRGILICRLPVGELGGRTAALVGRLILSNLLGALTAQGRRPAHDRVPVSIIIDEAQTLASGEAIERLLTQGRKFGAAVCLASQSPSLLGPTLPSVMTNCQTLTLFRLAQREAMLFSDRLGAVGTETVPRLPNYEACLTTPQLQAPTHAVFESAKPLCLSTEEAQATKTASRRSFGARRRRRRRSSRQHTNPSRETASAPGAAERTRLKDLFRELEEAEHQREPQFAVHALLLADNEMEERPSGPIVGPSLDSETEAQEQVAAIRAAQLSGDVADLPWLLARGSDLVAAVYRDVADSAFSEGTSSSGRLTILVRTPRRVMLLGPRLEESTGRGCLETLRKTQSDGGLVELPWLSVDAARIVACYWTSGSAG